MLNFLGQQRYSNLKFTGVLFVNEAKESNNYIGLVFGYHSNKKFYTVQWRNDNANYKSSTHKVGIRGIQIKVSF